MAQLPAFISFLPVLPSTSSRTSALRPAVTPRSTSRQSPVAVLDTPASNTYLQRHAEVILRDFLTRRAVNTVMYYMHELHDGPGHDWLSKFDNFSEKVKSRQFKDGDRFLDLMLNSPNEKATLKIGHPSGRFSRTYTFTIEPRTIAKRIIDVRNQLAGEWALDLKCVEAENLEIQRMNFERMLTSDESEIASKRNLIFEADPFANDQTPLRYKNYMALKTLITQHAIGRLLPYLRDCGSNHEYMYLLQFTNSYGAISEGDEFLNALMKQPVEFRTNPSHTIHPNGLAVQILELREVIAKEWISVMDYIPEEHKLSVLRTLENSMNASHDLPKDQWPTPEDNAADGKSKE